MLIMRDEDMMDQRHRQDRYNSAQTEVRLGFVSLLFLLLVSFTARGEVATIPQRGMLWEVVAANGATSYLLGSVHSEDARIKQRLDKLAPVFSSARCVIVETVLNGQSDQQLAAALRLPVGQTLDKILGPAWFGRAMTALAPLGFSAEQVNQFKPWAVMMILSMPTPGTGFFMDKEIMADATRRGQSLIGLEAAQEQVDVFDTLPLADQIVLLQETIASYPDFPRLLESVLKAYLADDLAELQRLNDESAGDIDPRLLQEINRRLLSVRNQRMAERLQVELQRGGCVAVVGALHLAGNQGLLSLLQSRGYRLRSVAASALLDHDIIRH